MWELFIDSTELPETLLPKEMATFIAFMRNEVSLSRSKGRALEPARKRVGIVRDEADGKKNERCCSLRIPKFRLPRLSQTLHWYCRWACSG